MTGGTRDVRPFGVMDGRRICGKFSFFRGKEVFQRLHFTQADFGQCGCGAMTGNAVFGILAVEHFLGTLARTLFGQLSGDKGIRRKRAMLMLNQPVIPPAA